jgi:predicted TPR repeat methyltransferase
VDEININPKIEEIFADFEVDGVKIPIFFMQYKGQKTTYLTYYTWYEEAELFADDANRAEVVSATIDVFSKGNFKLIVEAVKEKLKENGFTWTDNSPEDYEDDTGFYHVGINFYAEN